VGIHSILAGASAQLSGFQAIGSPTRIVLDGSETGSPIALAPANVVDELGENRLPASFFWPLLVSCNQQLNPATLLLRGMPLRLLSISSVPGVSYEFNEKSTDV
jgi:hypothetical protein